MKNLSWGISGYLILLDQKPIGQFDNCGWAAEFQKLVSNKHLCRPVTMIYSDGYNTMTTDTKPETGEE